MIQRNLSMRTRLFATCLFSWFVGVSVWAADATEDKFAPQGQALQRLKDAPYHGDLMVWPETEKWATLTAPATLAKYYLEHLSESPDDYKRVHLIGHAASLISNAINRKTGETGDIKAATSLLAHVLVDDNSVRTRFRAATSLFYIYVTFGDAAAEQMNADHETIKVGAEKWGNAQDGNTALRLYDLLPASDPQAACDLVCRFFPDDIKRPFVLDGILARHGDAAAEMRIMQYVKNLTETDINELRDIHAILSRIESDRMWRFLVAGLNDDRIIRYGGDVGDRMNKEGIYSSALRKIIHDSAHIDTQKMDKEQLREWCAKNWGIDPATPMEKIVPVPRPPVPSVPPPQPPAPSTQKKSIEPPSQPCWPKYAILSFAALCLAAGAAWGWRHFCRRTTNKL